MDNAFITGSHAYGLPTEKSDIDLAVLMDGEDANKLAILIGAKINGDAASRGGDYSLRIGVLNLLVFTDSDKFDAWKLATEMMRAFKPVTRIQAVKCIDGMIAGECLSTLRGLLNG